MPMKIQSLRAQLAADGRVKQTGNETATELQEAIRNLDKHDRKNKEGKYSGKQGK
jgi:hypothetical protein